MTRLAYLLDLTVVAELTRPSGNRRVFTLFQQSQPLCALGAPAVLGLLRGIGALPEGARRTELETFSRELLQAGPEVLPFDRDAAIWLAKREPERLRRNWSPLDGQLAAIAASRELSLISREASRFAGLPDLRVEDWFRP